MPSPILLMLRSERSERLEACDAAAGRAGNACMRTLAIREKGCEAARSPYLADGPIEARPWRSSLAMSPASASTWA